MQDGCTKWFRWGLINLAIVALYGVLMRYKILFPLPAFEQQHLLHAHSHFAFSGWISHFLYSGLTLLLSGYLPLIKLKKYRLLLAFNIVVSFGMLLSFTLQGYQAISISCSALSIALAIAVTIMFFRDRKYLPSDHPAVPWWKIALQLNILSAAGPLALAYMMATQTIDLQLQSIAIHFYLHFQYNGWFFFGSMAIMIACLPKSISCLKRYWLIFAITVIPTFCLSVPRPLLTLWLYPLIPAATITQLIAWVMLLSKLIRCFKSYCVKKPFGLAAGFFYTSALSITLKLILQVISAIPSVNQSAFSFRPAIIAYLHLILLCGYSLFFVGFLLSHTIIHPTAFIRRVALTLLTAVIVNELLLGIQALLSISIPFIHELLLGVALLLSFTTATLAIMQFKIKPIQPLLN